MAMSAAVYVPSRVKLSVDDFHKLGDAGILTSDSRVELIEGDLIEMAPIGGAHIGLVNRLTRVLVTAIGDLGIVSIQNPVALPPRSEPQPDIAVLRPGNDGVSAVVPQAKDVLLLIADSTLAYDRDTKVPLYARAGIPEVWVVDVDARRIAVHRGPAPTGYSSVIEVSAGDLAMELLPQVSIRVDALFN
jgi:Uma2 family endonuclease